MARIFFLTFCFITTVSAQDSQRQKFIEQMKPYSGIHVNGVDTTTLDGKVMCGYQGWFSTPGDGANRDWEHYGNKNMRPGNCTFDLWPDLREFTAGEKYKSPFKYADGSPAYLFSSCNRQTVERHFKWMKDYGIDGVFLQRFGTTIRSNSGFNKRNIVTANVQSGANKHGRSWAMMYDLSGLKKGETALIIDDWKLLTTKMKLLEDKSYQKHNGKAIVAIWGIGFNDKRQYSLQECNDLINFFKKQNLTVMLGIPTYWRTQRRDSVNDPLFHKILKKADILSPWTVGRYKNSESIKNYSAKTAADDYKWSTERKKDFMPVIFPGFSWYNLKKSKGEESDLNKIPRQGGKFLWEQAVEHKKLGAKMLYIAMFDEIDEGTAIFKCTNKVPVGESKFLTYEGLPSDHYLWLTGMIKKILNDERGKDFPPLRKK